MIIDLSALNTVTFNAQGTLATIGGGALVKDVTDAAYEHNVQILTPNCECVGYAGGVLGGGYSRFMGLYGYGIDNIVSFNIVTADARLRTVGPNDPDLGFAVRGAGPNFGIVTSLTVRAYPTPKEQNGAWLGALIFDQAKVESLVTAIEALELGPKMAIFMYFVTSGPPDFAPVVVAFPFYVGTEEEGRAAFASIFAVGPLVDQTSWLQYNRVNEGSQPFCVKGGRKPSYGAGPSKLIPQDWRRIWNFYVEFLQNEGTGASAVLLERYSLDKVKEIGDSRTSSYPWRDTFKYLAVAIPTYSDASLDGQANAFGTAVRSLWRSTDPAIGNAT